MQMTNWAGMQPQNIYSIPQIVDLLLGHKYFIPHQTVLSFGNQTDPFLKKNIEMTLQFFKILESHKLKNPVAVVTKKLIPDYFIDEIQSLQFVRPIFCLSYSGLPKTIEKRVNPEENRKNFQMLSKHGLSVVHFWRPLLEINGTFKTLQEVLDYVVQYAIASVYIGIKLNPHLMTIYKKNPNLRVPEFLSEYYGDYIPEGVEERLRMHAKRNYPHYPLYMHTSCAISLAISIPDYNATVYTDPICKASECPSWKRNICERARAIPSQNIVRNLLDRIGLNLNFKIANNAIYILGEVKQDDYTFLLHQLNYPLIVRKMRFTRVLRGSIFRRDAGES
jgi:DNA repair photolyase